VGQNSEAERTGEKESSEKPQIEIMSSPSDLIPIQDMTRRRRGCKKMDYSKIVAILSLAYGMFTIMIMPILLAIEYKRSYAQLLCDEGYILLNDMCVHALLPYESDVITGPDKYLLRTYWVTLITGIVLFASSYVFLWKLKNKTKVESAPPKKRVFFSPQDLATIRKWIEEESVFAKAGGHSMISCPWVVDNDDELENVVADMHVVESWWVEKGVAHFKLIFGSNQKSEA
jgi:hypothetical protein